MAVANRRTRSETDALRRKARQLLKNELFPVGVRRAAELIELAAQGGIPHYVLSEIHNKQHGLRFKSSHKEMIWVARSYLENIFYSNGETPKPELTPEPLPEIVTDVALGPGTSGSAVKQRAAINFDTPSAPFLIERVSWSGRRPGEVEFIGHFTAGVLDSIPRARLWTSAQPISLSFDDGEVKDGDLVAFIRRHDRRSNDDKERHTFQVKLWEGPIHTPSTAHCGES